ncbi:hypothetical protein [Pseudomonas syringae]|nr:hypothetical protein [Pseudomonas syringae]
MNIDSNSHSGAVDNSPAASRRDPAARLTGNNGLQFDKILKEATASAQPRRSPVDAVSSLEARNNIMRIARSDPAEASQLACFYAYNSLGGELLDVSDRPNIRYSATGELVTSESSAYFARTNIAIQRARNELYQTEIEKGTPPTQILEKIFDFNDALPQRFLEMAGW